MPASHGRAARMSRTTRRLVAAAVTGAFAAAALAMAWAVIDFVGVGWGVLLIVLAVLLVRFTPPWWFFLAPDDLTTWAALLPAMWRWANRGPSAHGGAAPDARTTPAAADGGTRIADRPAPGRW